MNVRFLMAFGLAFSAAFSPFLKGQTPMDLVLENVEIGMTRGEFFENRAGQKAVASGEKRTEFFEKAAEKSTEKGPLEGARFFFDNDGERVLYQIDLEYSSEKAARAAAVAQFGQPNYPKKADFWIFDAFAGGATLGWLEGRKMTIAADLPETEWSGNALFQISDASILEQFEPLAPSEWAAEEWDLFLKSIENQFVSARHDFKKMRGELVGEAGSGMVECLEPLAFSIYSSIFQDEENRWTASNTMIEGCSEAKKAAWLNDFRRLLPAQTAQKRGVFEYKLEEVAAEDGIDPANFLRFSIHFGSRKEDVLIEVAAFFLETGDGWAVDFLVVKN